MHSMITSTHPATAYTYGWLSLLLTFNNCCTICANRVCLSLSHMVFGSNSFFDVERE